MYCKLDLGASNTVCHYLLGFKLPPQKDQEVEFRRLCYLLMLEMQTLLTCFVVLD